MDSRYGIPTKAQTLNAFSPFFQLLDELTNVYIICNRFHGLNPVKIIIHTSFLDIEKLFLENIEKNDAQRALIFEF